MSTKILANFAAAALLTALATTTAYAGIISNGDFQTGSLSSWTTFTTANGTTGSGLPAVVSYDTTGTGASFAAKFDVGDTTTCCTQDGGGIRQTIIAPDTAYYSFFANIAAENDLTGQINGDPGRFRILVDNVGVGTTTLFGFSTSHEVVRGSVSGTIILTAGAHVLSIEVTRCCVGGGNNAPTQYVDNVGVTEAALPEPGTWATMLGGACVVMARRRYLKA